MSAQGNLPDGSDDADLGLIETLLWVEDKRFFLIDEHLARLARSAAALGFAHDGDTVVRCLEEAVVGRRAPRLRVRLILDRSGRCSVSAQPIDPMPAETVWRVAVATTRFTSDDPLLQHKTTRRGIYENALAEASVRNGAQEVLFLNEREELCEGARSNIFIMRNGNLLTPPLACGVLPGTLRARLLEEGRAREATLRMADLSPNCQWYMGNSVRGLVRACLIGD